MFEAIICLNLGVSVLSSEYLAERYVDQAEEALGRFLELAKELFGLDFFTLVVHQASLA